MDGRFEDYLESWLMLFKNVILNDLGAIVGGATSQGCETVLNMVKAWGGKEEATVLIYGGKLPAM